jgi:uncharacterized caspase-like protein
MRAAFRFLVLFSALLATSPLLSSDRVALVIGIEDYEHAPELKNPANDASSIAVLLSDIGFELTTSPGGKPTWINPTTDEFYEALEKFSEKTRGASVGLFYFAGHGVEVDGENYLLPSDSVLEQRSQLRS